jgi:hypothetical protein
MEDSERLLADALRAQAASAPVPPPAPQDGGATATGQSGIGPAPAASEPVGHEVAGLGPGYGLISGAGVDGPPDPLVTGAGGQPVEETAPAPAAPVPPSRPLAAGWVLLLAVLLGLAAGAVAGLITLF